jgi:DGQHR domain-containing protein
MATKKTLTKKTSAKKNGSVPYQFPCLVTKQGKYQLVCFVTTARTLNNFVAINQRDPDAKTGYQRVLSMSRVRVIKTYIDAGKPLPTSVLISLEKEAELTEDGDTGNWVVTIPRKKTAGWVIDGQHRLAGASEAQHDVELIVVAFIGLNLQEQVNQFVTINREAKGVPTSLYLDLLKDLPRNKTEVELAKDRSVDIADSLRKDEESPFYAKIIFLGSPQRGELSLTNFVRKVYPLVQKNKGLLEAYSYLEQSTILNNYYKALEQVFPKFFDSTKSVFFKTLGFGAVINALPTIFNLSIKHYQGFTIRDVITVLRKVEDFDFAQWDTLGSGNAVEIQAGADLVEWLRFRFEDSDEQGTVIRL